jgi:hypothetical protein
MVEIKPLRRRIIEDMKVRSRSPVTQRCYVHAVAKFAQHFNRSPNRFGLADIRAYQLPPDRDRYLVGRFQRRGLRAALLLRCHARPHRNGRAHSRCAQAPDCRRRS